MNARRWLGRPDNDAGSMAVAVLVTIVAVGLSVSVARVASTQVLFTRAEVQRTRTLHAAMAGLEVALGQLRASSGAAGYGVLSKLPRCDASIQGTTGAAAYQVRIHYLDVNPAGKSMDWVQQHVMCHSGTPTTAPAYAVLVGTGTDQGTAASSASRSVRAVYAFRTSDQNAPGGLVPVTHKPGYAYNLCLDAGKPPWKAATQILMQECAAGQLQQKFVYRPDLSLTLVETMTADQPDGMCLDPGINPGLHSRVTLEVCTTDTKPRQRWAFDASANFLSTTTGTSNNSYCLNVAEPDKPNSLVWLGSEATDTCRRIDFDNKESWEPEPSVGAAAANPPNTTNQLVNFEKFGHCLDIPHGRVNWGYLVTFGCKQAFDGVDVGWSQKWAPPTTACQTGAVCGTITSTAHAKANSPQGTYCMHSPGSTAEGQVVDAMLMCPAGTPPASMTWTVYGETGDPLTRYHIVDYRGYCVSTSTTQLYTLDGPVLSKIVLKPCAAVPSQMWSAPVNALDPRPLKDVHEI